MKKNNYLILSIDLDEWYHCRWAVGFLPVARWKSSKECFKDYYKSDKPGGEIIKPTHLILDLLEKQGLKATFFILGEIAQQYPNLVPCGGQQLGFMYHLLTIYVHWISIVGWGALVKR